MHEKTGLPKGTVDPTIQKLKKDGYLAGSERIMKFLTGVSIRLSSAWKMTYLKTHKYGLRNERFA